MKPSSLTQRVSSSMQLAHADEIVRIERADAMDEVVADLRPYAAGLRRADVVRHAGGARREDGDVGAALALELELGLFQAVADLVVADSEVGRRGAARCIGEAGELAIPEQLQLARRRRVMAVAVDDHVLEPLLAEEAPPWTCPVAAVKPTAAGQPASLAGGARLEPRPCGAPARGTASAAPRLHPQSPASGVVLISLCARNRHGCATL